MSEIKSSAQANEAEQAPFMTPGTKRGRGRPPGSRKRDQATTGKTDKTSGGGTTQGVDPSPQAPNMPPPIPTAKIVRPLVGVLSRLGEGYVDHPKAAMTPEEMEAICESMGLVLDKWMPLVAGQFGAELMLGVALGQYSLRIMAMRKYLDAERKKQEDMDRARAKSGEGEPRTGQPSPLESVQYI